MGCKGRDAEATATLLGHFDPLIRKWARWRITISNARPHEVEDIFQDCTEAFLRAVHDFDPDRTYFTNYIKGVYGWRTLNRQYKVFEQHKHESNYDHHALMSMLSARPSLDDSPEDRVAITEAYRRLTLKQGAMLWLTSEGFTSDEIAQGFRITPRAVRRVLARARRTIAAAAIIVTLALPLVPHNPIRAQTNQVCEELWVTGYVRTSPDFNPTTADGTSIFTEEPIAAAHRRFAFDTTLYFPELGQFRVADRGYLSWNHIDIAVWSRREAYNITGYYWGCYSN